MEIPKNSATIVAKIQEQMIYIHPDIRLDGIYARNQSEPAAYTFIPWYMFSRPMLQRVRDELALESEALTVGFRPMRARPDTEETNVVGLSIDTAESCMWFGVRPDTGTPYRRNNPYLKRKGMQVPLKPNFSARQVAVAI